MKGLMIKGLVIILGVSLYFNVASLYQNNRLEEDKQRMENQLADLEELMANLEEEDIALTEENQCQKLYEITISVISTDDDVNETYDHCTNELYLGDALDEIKDELEIVYDPNFDKDYIYGRFVVSFYGLSKEFEEFYEITIDGEKAVNGIDYIMIEDESVYSFTLKGWSY